MKPFPQRPPNHAYGWYCKLVVVGLDRKKTFQTKEFTHFQAKIRFHLCEMMSMMYQPTCKCVVVVRLLSISNLSDTHTHNTEKYCNPLLSHYVNHINTVQIQQQDHSCYKLLEETSRITFTDTISNCG